MAKKDPRIDTYIDKAAPFAQPILKHIRKVVHGACPGVGETLKWNNPSFEYKGMLCGMAAFKAHVVFGFWKAKLLAERGFPEAGDNPLGMGRITSLNDLPGEARLKKMITAAAALNDEGIVEKRPKKAPKEIKPPAYFLVAIKRNKKAQTAYDAFSPSHKREYLEWITEAKTDETRNRRLAQAIEWMAAGKSRNWKYERA
jgi:hypothetical protein